MTIFEASVTFFNKGNVWGRGALISLIKLCENQIILVIKCWNKSFFTQKVIVIPEIRPEVTQLENLYH